MSDVNLVGGPADLDGDTISWPWPEGSPLVYVEAADGLTYTYRIDQDDFTEPFTANFYTPNDVPTDPDGADQEYVPKGEKGERGLTGPQGPQGERGFSGDGILLPDGAGGVVEATGDDDWCYAATIGGLTNSWYDAGGLPDHSWAFRREGRRVRFRGLIGRITGACYGVQFIQLPASFRPIKAVLMPGVSMIPGAGYSPDALKACYIRVIPSGFMSYEYGRDSSGVVGGDLLVFGFDCMSFAVGG